MTKEDVTSRRGGKVSHPLYHVYNAMLDRCRNPNNPHWDRYGGRGIYVCERWKGREGFWNFVDDMGERPAGLTLDRINNNGPYSPENCRWASRSIQVTNRDPFVPPTDCRRGHPYEVGVRPDGVRFCRECARANARKHFVQTYGADRPRVYRKRTPEALQGLYAKVGTLAPAEQVKAIAKELGVGGTAARQWQKLMIKHIKEQAA